MKTTYRTAIHDAMPDALRDDPRVVLMGEDVGRYGGTYAASAQSRRRSRSRSWLLGFTHVVTSPSVGASRRMPRASSLERWPKPH